MNEELRLRFSNARAKGMTRWIKATIDPKAELVMFVAESPQSSDFEKDFASFQPYLQVLLLKLALSFPFSLFGPPTLRVPVSVWYTT